MLTRTPETELMDEEAQAAAYAQADFSQPHEHCVDLFAGHFTDIPATAAVLDLGCGAADVTARFARRYAGLRFDAVDGAAAMLRQARLLLERQRLAGRVTLIQQRLPGPPLPAAPYDIIISNSLLHHLHDPQVLWQSVRANGRPQTLVYIMDLTRPASLAGAQALVDRYAAGEPPVLRQDFYNSLLAAFTPQEIAAQLRQAGLMQLHIETVSDRHLIVYGYL